jgi:hypothetical protein
VGFLFFDMIDLHACKVSPLVKSLLKQMLILPETLPVLLSAEFHHLVTIKKLIHSLIKICWHLMNYGLQQEHRMLFLV